MTDVTIARAAQIDSLRTFAVAAVVFSHTIDERYAIGDYSFFLFGAYGVSIFFVISAFLITGQLLAIKDIRRDRGDGIGAPLRAFYAKRALRLLPAYYVLLLAICAIDLGSVRQEAPWHAVMASNILFALDPHLENISPVGHFWTLSIEWQFYLLWPLIVLTVSERVLIAIALVCLALATSNHAEILPIATVFERTSIVYSLDALALGALLAIGVRRGWRFDRYFWLAWPLAIVMVGGPALNMLGYRALGGVTEFAAREAMNLIFAMIVLRASRGFGGPVGKLLDNAVLRYLGVISYGIYLYHQVLIELYARGFHLMGRPLPVDWGVGLSGLVFVAAAGVAAVSWRCVEAPINRFRHRFDYRARAAAPVVTDAAVIEELGEGARAPQG